MNCTILWAAIADPKRPSAGSDPCFSIAPFRYQDLASGPRDRPLPQEAKAGARSLFRPKNPPIGFGKVLRGPPAHLVQTAAFYGWWGVWSPRWDYEGRPWSELLAKYPGGPVHLGHFFTPSISLPVHKPPDDCNPSFLQILNYIEFKLIYLEMSDFVAWFHLFSFLWMSISLFSHQAHQKTRIFCFSYL